MDGLQCRLVKRRRPAASSDDEARDGLRQSPAVAINREAGLFQLGPTTPIRPCFAPPSPTTFGRRESANVDKVRTRADAGFISPLGEIKRFQQLSRILREAKCWKSQERGFLHVFYPRPLNLPYYPCHRLRGNLVRTGDQGKRWRRVGSTAECLLGDEPPGPALEPYVVCFSWPNHGRPAGRLREERRTGGPRVAYKLKTSEPEAARFPDCLWAEFFKIARRESGRGEGEALSRTHPAATACSVMAASTPRTSSVLNGFSRISGRWPMGSASTPARAPIMSPVTSTKRCASCGWRAMRSR